jgi:sugar/nucleoside kinase (ribokinase family)
VDTQHHTRNIFFDLTGVVGADPAWPDAEVIRGARVLFLDHIGVEGMLRAARIAREAGIPLVADFERSHSPLFAQLLELVDHLILSRAFAAHLTGEATPASAALRLWTPARRTVVVTDGEHGCWYLTETQAAPQHHPAYRVDVVDTTGCGDVFHGAYASALARGLEVSDRIRFASAAAALKATRAGGQQGIPTRADVDVFLASPR